MHYERARDLQELRQKTLASAYLVHPERFVHRAPIAPPVPTAVWINPPPSSKAPVGPAPQGAELEAKIQQVEQPGGALVIDPQEKEDSNLTYLVVA